MLDEMRTFCAIVRHGSMSRAAEDLHLSQPAVSQRLRALEQAYRAQLLRRTNRGVELTPAGEVVSRYARRFLSLNDSLEDEMEALRAAEPKQAIIGATSSIGAYALPCTVYLFQQKHPDARIQLVSGNRAEILHRLNDGALDLALIEGPPLRGDEGEPPGWQTVTVSEEDLVLITPTTGPWAEIERFQFDDLRHVPLILREQGSGTRAVVEHECAARGLKLSDLNVNVNLNSDEAIKTSVASGHGVALISKWCTKVEARLGSLRIAPMTDVRFISYWTLFCPATAQRTQLVKALIKTLRSPTERGFC